MKGIQTMFVKDNKVGINTRFGPTWPGERCGAKTRAGNDCKRPAHKKNGRCSLHGGLSTGPKTTAGRTRISEANFKHGKYTKNNLSKIQISRRLGKEIKFQLDTIEARLLRQGIIKEKQKY